MPTHKDINCSIKVNGRILQEYQDSESAESPEIRTVYIEAQDSVYFLISCETLPGYSFNVTNRISFRAYLDGKYMCRGSINATNKRKRLKLEGSYGVSELGNDYVHPFQFTGVSLVEDHDSDIRINPLSLAEMGEISVYAIRTNLVDIIHGTPKARAARLETVPDTVNEKALKGRDLTHSIKLGPRKELRRMASRGKSVKYDSIEEPYAHFRFLYRSKGALQSLGLIPRTPPIPNPPALILDNHARETAIMKEEIAQLRARLKSRDDKLQTKREIKDEEDENSLHRKRLKLPRATDEIETIDLTGED